MIDMTRKRRHPVIKLTVEEVIEIRRRYATGKESTLVLAKHFPVGKSQIHRIINNERWKHV